MMEVFK
jgi:hypothetical protein